MSNSEARLFLTKARTIELGKSKYLKSSVSVSLSARHTCILHLCLWTHHDVYLSTTPTLHPTLSTLSSQHSRCSALLNSHLPIQTQHLRSNSIPRPQHPTPNSPHLKEETLHKLHRTEHMYSTPRTSGVLSALRSTLHMVKPVTGRVLFSCARLIHPSIQVAV